MIRATETNRKKCRCGETETTAKWQRFKNNTSHLRLECVKCGRYRGYAKKSMAKYLLDGSSKPELVKKIPARPGLWTAWRSDGESNWELGAVGNSEAQALRRGRGQAPGGLLMALPASRVPAPRELLEVDRTASPALPDRQDQVARQLSLHDGRETDLTDAQAKFERWLLNKGYFRTSRWLDACDGLDLLYAFLDEHPDVGKNHNAELLEFAANIGPLGQKEAAP